MPGSAEIVRDALPVVALLVLLVSAFRHPRPLVEAGVSVGAVALALAPGLVGEGVLDAGEVGTTLRDLAPVVVFLATILVVSDVCARSGLFVAVGDLLRSRPDRLMTTAFLVAAAVTAVLSLDATVVLLTPVVVAAAHASGVSSRPAAFACLRMANSASLLLPVSNLTNLLALPSLDLTFTGFAARTAPVLLVVLLVEYAVLRLLFRHEALHTATSGPPPTAARLRTPLPVVPTVAVGAMLVGFAVASPFGVAPAWVSGATAICLVAWARARHLADLREAAQATQAGFALFVLALGVVVAAISAGFLGDVVAHLLPGSTGFLALLAIALVATLLASALTNLSATLLVVPLVAPLGDTAVLAALLGLNIGSGLTVTGSLANLLWRRVLGPRDDPGLREFHRVSLVATPISLVAAVATLFLVS